jgi:phospholipase C
LVAIQHIFVLMLENHSFDQMLGFSGITGTDAISGRATSVNGLTLACTSLLQLAHSWKKATVGDIVQRQGGKWPPPPPISLRALFGSSISNTFNGQTYSPAQPASYAMAVDPAHEFSYVLLQLCGVNGQNAYLAASDAFRNSGGPPPTYPEVYNTGFAAAHAAAIGNSNDGLGGNAYRRAVGLTANAVERRYLRRRLAEL